MTLYYLDENPAKGTGIYKPVSYLNLSTKHSDTKENKENSLGNLKKYTIING